MTSAVEQAGAWPAPHVAAGALWLGGGGELLEVRTGQVDLVQPWASLSKLVTALAVLVAVEEGTLGLDEPAGPTGSTVRHLLSHASGLGPDGDTVLAAPGRRRIYSNAGFEVLAATLAERAQMPFGRYAAEAVLQPLGMATAELPAGASPAAGMVGSLRDLLRLAGELLRPSLVSAAMVARATTVAFAGLVGVVPGVGRFDPCDWGLGFELRDGKEPHWTGSANSAGTFGHFGRSGGFVWIDPAAGCAAAALSGRDFGAWALERWPAWSDGVLGALGSGCVGSRP